MTLQSSSSASLTKLAAERLLAIGSDELSASVKGKAILCLLDYLGALVSGLSAPWAPSLLRYASKRRPPAPKDAEEQDSGAFVISLSELTTAETAALTNGAIAHSIIRDDMHLGAGSHLGVMVISAALALAQRDHWTSDQLLKAIVGGYEMAALLGQALRSSQMNHEHFRPSGIVGAFGAAAAAIAGSTGGSHNSHGITSSVAMHALGLAANRGGGLNEWAWAGGMEINTQIGFAARDGLDAFDLAMAGIGSSATALEGQDGLFAAYAREDSRSRAEITFRRLLAETELGAGVLGVKFKPFAGCNFVMTPMAVAIVIAERMAAGAVSTRSIEKVTVVTTTAAKKYPGCNYSGRFDRVQQTKMSLQYAVAMALLCRGDFSEETYAQFHNDQLADIVQACCVEADPQYDLALLHQGEQPCRIEVDLTNGTEYKEFLRDVPWLDEDQVKQRCKHELMAHFDCDVVLRIMQECQSLDCKDRSCASLFNLLMSPCRNDG